MMFESEAPVILSTNSPILQAILQSKVTVLMLTSLSVLSAAKQYLGDPIHCIFDTRYGEWIEINNKL